MTSFNYSGSDAQQTWWRCLIAIVFLAGSVQAFGQKALAPRLIKSSGAVSGKNAAEPSVVRSRAVGLDFESLMRFKIGDTVNLNLFDDLALDALIDDYKQTGPGTFHWRGHIAGDAHSTVGLVLHKGSLAGIVRVPALGVFRIRSTPDRGQVIEELDPTSLPPCAPPLVAPIKGAGQPPARAGRASGTDGPAEVNCLLIDIMILYTPEARDQEGGVAAIEALAYLAADQTNVAFENSLIDARVRLVYTGMVDYAESGDFGTEISRLQNPGDNFMDEAHSLRNQYGADDVSLLVSHTQGGTICGVGYLMVPESSDFEAWAFNVCNAGCVAGGLTYEHELGHNMGCHHDRDNAGGPGAFEYSFGYRFNGDDSVQYRTIMSYAPGSRISYFSNPNILYEGQPIGLPEGHLDDRGMPDSADNARTINETADTVAAFRPSGEGVFYNWSPPAMIQPTDLVTSDRFGASVSLDGDLAIIGAYTVDGVLADTGAAYIYQFDNGTSMWVQQAKIVAASSSANDRFGVSVSIHANGDGTGFAAVGAYQAEDGGRDSGCAYVFRKVAPTAAWVQEAILLPMDINGGDLCGRSVSVASSIAGEMVLVGSYSHDHTGPFLSNSGAAYIFRRTGVPTNGGWEEEAKLEATDAAAQDQFGFSVSLAVSPINGEQMALIGALLDDSEGIPSIANSGSAYVFKKVGETWTQVAKLLPPSPAANDQFGYTVDLDITSLGRTAIVGSWLADGTAPGGTSPLDTGAATIYRDSSVTDTWVHEANLRAPTPVANDRFGSSVAISGNVALVGAYLRNATTPALNDSGAVYSFRKAIGPGSNWSLEATITQPNPLAGDQFGFSAALDGGNALIGAWQRPRETFGFAGAAYHTKAGSVTDCNGNNVLDVCDIAQGTSFDVNHNGLPDECEKSPCPADIAPQPNGDGVVNVSDLLLILSSWGPCPAPPSSCDADIAPPASPGVPAGNGNVNVSDLLMVIGAWGDCEPL